MKQNLPYLNQERLNKIFEHVYDIVSNAGNNQLFDDERMKEFLAALLAMQSFNYRFRPDDVRELFFLMENDFSFERNSEGTTLWLALALAIKELYNFSDRKFIAVMSQLLNSDNA